MDSELTSSSEQPDAELASKNDAPATISKKKAGRWIFLGIVLIALVVFVNNFTGTRADLAALKSMDVPLNGADVIKGEPTEGDNAALLYEEATEKYSNLARGGSRFDLTGFRPKTQYGSMLHASTHDARIEEIADLVRKGAVMPRCVVDPVYPDPKGKFALSSREYNDFSVLSGFLCSVASAEMDHGSVADSLRDLGLAENIPNQMARDLGSEAFDAWFNHEGSFQRNWMQCASNHRKDPVVLRGLAEIIQRPFAMMPIKQVVAGDFPRDFDNYVQAQRDPYGYKVHIRQHSETDMTDMGILMRQAVNQMLHEWRTLFESFPANTNDWRGYKTAFEKASDQVSGKWPAKALLEDPFIKYRNYCDQWAVILATRRLDFLTSYLLLYRLDHKSVPDSLPDLGQDSIDPFTSKPFKYQRIGDGFVMMSVGPNGQDNRVTPLANGERPDDIIFDFS